MEDEQATGLAGGYDLVGYSSFTRNLEKRFEEKMVIVLSLHFVHAEHSND